MFATASSDARLYEVVHQLLEMTRNECNERREAERHDYPGPLLVAPYRGANLPGSNEFRAFACRDISPKGFCLLCDGKPDFTRLVVALGNVPFRFLSPRSCMRPKPSWMNG